jgi:hypothetical protein
VTEAPAAEAGLRGEAQAEDGTDRGRRAERRARYAFLAFAAVVATAIPLLVVLGRSLWFSPDDWTFLAGRTGGDLGDLLRPEGDHWSTLPILAYRLLWWLVGVRSYLPYQVVVVMLHLTAAVLLRAVMRRAGVGPWISTTAASLFVLFGAGYDNIVWAIQITADGSLVFGLTHLLLADHDGPVDRRDWLGIVAGFAGLLCSGVGVTMTVVVGLATLFRRGWRIAALHTAPLGVIYVVWWVAVGRNGYQGTDRPSIRQLASFVRLGIDATFEAMGSCRVPGLRSEYFS